jgi:hypothetical protein
MRERRIRGRAVTRRVEIHDAFSLGADHLGEFGAAVRRQQGGREAVGTVERVTQAGDLECGASAPCGELALDALEVRDESAAGMGDVRSTESAQ